MAQRFGAEWAARWPLRLARGRLARVLATVAVGLAGAVLGVLLAGGVDHRVGPFDAHFHLSPSAAGGTTVLVSPLGALRLRSHDGPLHLSVRVTQLRPASAEQIARDPASLSHLGDEVADDVRSAVQALAIRSGVAAVVGALLAGGLVFRKGRRTLLAGATGLAAFGASAGVAVITWRPASLTEPQFTGLLASAPAVVGNVKDIVSRFDVYRQELGKLVGNVSELYGVASTLPTFEPDPSTIRVLWVSDIHDNPAAANVIASLVRQFKVGAVFDTGDISDHGSALENQLVAFIGRLGVPYVYVRGNHDSTLTEQAVDQQPRTLVLRGQPHTVVGLRVIGAGDPRFTPDRSTATTSSQEKKLLEQLGEQLAEDVHEAEPPPVDLVLVHDPTAAPPLYGEVPLILAGHLHHREHHRKDGTLLLVQGSTGGAGLRGLEGNKPKPLEASVLYFNSTTKMLEAYDDITVGGFGTSTAQISRHVVAKPGPSPAPSASPSAPPSASATPSPGARPVPTTTGGRRPGLS